MSVIIPIVLQYEEPEWTDRTVKSLQDAGIEKIWFADRRGVGSMSKAFNEAVIDVLYHEKPPMESLIWWVTNVTFTPDVPQTLLSCFDGVEGAAAAAVHPKFDSDHPHIRQGGWDVPFLEWTAPMIRVKALYEVGLLDQDMPYVGMDIDWCWRAKQQGWFFEVPDCRVEHKYLRHNKPFDVSLQREKMRNAAWPGTQEKLKKKWGDNWKSKLCPSKSC